jgi:hypothetical protein
MSALLSGANVGLGRTSAWRQSRQQQPGSDMKGERDELIGGARRDAATGWAFEPCVRGVFREARKTAPEGGCAPQRGRFGNGQNDLQIGGEGRESRKRPMVVVGKEIKWEISIDAMDNNSNGKYQST